MGIDYLKPTKTRSPTIWLKNDKKKKKGRERGRHCAGYLKPTKTRSLTIWLNKEKKGREDEDVGCHFKFLLMAFCPTKLFYCFPCFPKLVFASTFLKKPVWASKEKEKFGVFICFFFF